MRIFSILQPVTFRILWVQHTRMSTIALQYLDIASSSCIMRFFSITSSLLHRFCYVSFVVAPQPSVGEQIQFC